MAEVLSLHVGGAGIRLGSACWEFYCAEHGLTLDGTSSSDDVDGDGTTTKSSHWRPNERSPETFFKVTSKGRHVPRALFLDTESSALDELRRARDLFDVDSMVLMAGDHKKPKQSSSSQESWRSCYHDWKDSKEARDAIERSMEQIRKLAEDCASKL